MRICGAAGFAPQMCFRWVDCQLVHGPASLMLIHLCWYRVYGASVVVMSSWSWSLSEFLLFGFERSALCFAYFPGSSTIRHRPLGGPPSAPTVARGHHQPPANAVHFYFYLRRSRSLSLSTSTSGQRAAGGHGRR